MECYGITCSIDGKSYGVTGYLIGSGGGGDACDGGWSEVGTRTCYVRRIGCEACWSVGGSSTGVSGTRCGDIITDASVVSSGSKTTGRGGCHIRSADGNSCTIRICPKRSGNRIGIDGTYLIRVVPGISSITCVCTDGGSGILGVGVDREPGGSIPGLCPGGGSGVIVGIGFDTSVAGESRLGVGVTGVGS